jgi:arsenite-transporting ATPase
MEGYFSKWITMQQIGLKEIEESFFDIPRFYLELQKEELRTLPILERIAAKLFEEIDITNVLFCQEAFQIDYEKDAIVIKVFLPFANKEELELSQNENELILGVKNEVRRFPLPKDVNNKEISGARFEEGYLNISFT